MFSTNLSTCTGQFAVFACEDDDFALKVLGERKRHERLFPPIQR